MSKLHYCLNGRPVTEQVVLYQETGDSADYLPIQLYYDNYKDHWYAQLDNYMDRMTFESDFDYKLSVAIKTFKTSTAVALQKKNGYGSLGAFNGFFYKILANWKSNIKTYAFRIKRHPSVQCPACGRSSVGRITAEHLQHYKSVSDLPKFVVWKGDIFEVSTQPKQMATTWGEKTNAKLDALESGDLKSYSECKRRIKWPWYLSDGDKGVLCPFTKEVVPCLDEDYIRTLDDRYSRYAEPMTWAQWEEQYPHAQIQSEIFDLHRPTGKDQKSVLQDYVSRDCRVPQSVEVVDYQDIQDGKVPSVYEHAFFIIESFIKDETDQDILKLIATGYTVDDVASTLDLDKKEVRTRIKSVRSEELQKILVDNV